MPVFYSLVLNYLLKINLFWLVILKLKLTLLIIINYYTELSIKEYIYLNILLINNTYTFN